MTNPWVSIAFSVAVSLLVTKVHAGTMRYALIIGNNVGVDENGEEPFPDLLHATREARRLREQLIRVSNFDDTDKRTRLLVNATVADVKEAFADLARQRKADEKLMGDMESIFFLYYTGHGLAGKLLLTDGPMSSDTLTDLFNQVGADFSIGVFDACYSGSLDTLLKKKGIRPIRGLNMAHKMPEQVLSSKGSVWFVSSGPGQPSYEDRNMGGVFTHFFIEALEKADSDGPGITLDSIWKYAQQKTVAYTMQHSRHQTPEQFVSKMRSQAPLLFSFPNRETATLVLSKQLEGRFALSYADGHLAKFFDKKAGSTKEILVYPGKIELYLFDGLVGKETASMHLDAGETVVVHPLKEKRPTTGIGQKANPLFAKGIGVGTVTATAIKPAISLLIGVGYKFMHSNENLYYPQHQILLPFRLDLAKGFGGMEFVLGFQQNDNAISDNRIIPGAAMSGGMRIELSSLELQFGLGVYWGYKRNISYPDGTGGDTTSKGSIFHPTIEAGVIFPNKNKVFFNLSIHVGPIYAPHKRNTEVSDEKSWWSAAGGVSLTIFYKGKTS